MTRRFLQRQFLPVWIWTRCHRRLLWTIPIVKTTRSWDIFCKVIDNYGDIGVSWRLAVDLAARGHGVRLWVDDARALAWMAPGAGSGVFPGVRVLPWAMSANAAALADLQPADVWIEGFGCELEPAFVARRFAAMANTAGDQPLPVWINPSRFGTPRQASWCRRALKAGCHTKVRWRIWFSNW